ncbi:unnamed protein product [Adineta ricciae]|uniref:Kinesin light chain n=1 Tax=Adineta ricciae TaxID=249248 RepID=A0A815AR39_ADIRI|nr:unnamed protein product [Adineta ricciae]CAF1260815.1 unnamed protein product [Adineta ricciae]
MASFTSPKIIENCVILWLDDNRNFSTEDNKDSIAQFRSIVNAVETFKDIDSCRQRLTQLKNEKVFFVVSDTLLNEIAAFEDNFVQLSSIYVFCSNSAVRTDKIKSFRKGRGIFTNMTHLCNELKTDVRRVEKNLLCGDTISPSANLTDNDLPPSFMYCQVLKENFFKLEDDSDAKRKFIEYCKSQYVGNISEMKYIEDFQATYDRESEKKSPIWWYTNQCFLYQMLNRALRLLDIEVLMHINFYIRDLHEQIKRRHKHPREALPPVVYRGQGLSKSDFDKLKTNSLQSFNNFLSTTTKQPKAVEFVRYALHNPDYPDSIGILWEIPIASSVSSVPFTLVEDITAIKEECEVLFSIGAVFRIKSKEQEKIEELSLWRIKLALTEDRDSSLTRLTDHIRRSLGSGTGWRPLGQLMIKMGHFSKAKEIYEKLIIGVAPEDKLEFIFLHNQLGHVEKQMGNLTEAFEHYQKAINCSKGYLSPHDSQLSSIYSNIGVISKKLKRFDEALTYFNLVLEIDRSTSDPNRLEIAVDYNNIGSVLDDQGKYAEALNNYEKALEIKLAHLQPDHPSLANNYSNIGVIHRKMGDCSTALSFYEKALAIQKKTLQPNHSAFITTYSNMVSALHSLNRIDEAIKCATEAANIAKEALGTAHPETKRRKDILDKLEKKQ